MRMPKREGGTPPDWGVFYQLKARRLKTLGSQCTVQYMFCTCTCKFSHVFKVRSTVNIRLFEPNNETG